MHLFHTQLFHTAESETDKAIHDPIERPRYGNQRWARQTDAFARKYGHRQTVQVAMSDRRMLCGACPA
jgi:hypothetical protein